MYTYQRMKFWAHFLIKNYKEVENIWDRSTQDPPHTTLGGTPRSKKPTGGTNCPQGRCFTSLTLIKSYLANESFQSRVRCGSFFSSIQVSVTVICVQNFQGQQQSGEIKSLRPELSLEEFQPHKQHIYTEILMPLCRIHTMSPSRENNSYNETKRRSTRI